MLAKSLTFMAGADAAGIVLGARVPIILTSRADSVTTRLASPRWRLWSPRHGGSTRKWRWRDERCHSRGQRGSSSIKFSLFLEQGERSTCCWEGKSRVSTLRPGSRPGTWPAPLSANANGRRGNRLATTGRDAPGRLLARATGGTPACRRRTPGGAWRSRIHRTSAPDRRDCRAAGRVVPAGAAAPAPQSRGRSGPLRPAARICRRWPASTRPSIARQPEVAQALRCRASITERGVRRYGFHGLSYEYIASSLPEVDARAAAGRVVVAHLGNGASMCAIRGGQERRPTMGFTGARRTADGHALRPARSRRAAVSDGCDSSMEPTRSRSCSTSSPACSAYPASPATCASCWRPATRGRQVRGRLFRLPHRPGAGLAGRRAGRARRPGVHRRHRRARRADPRRRLRGRRLARGGTRSRGQHGRRSAHLHGEPAVSGLGHSDQRRADDRSAHPPHSRIRRITHDR